MMNKEVENFEKLADSWWDSSGPFKILHEINPVRLEYIVDNIEKIFPKISDLTALDIGCGGGILTIPMARLGIKVTGMDPGEKNIAAAKNYAEKVGISVKYINTTVEEHVEKQQYDIVTLLEVIEHIDEPNEFLTLVCDLVKPGGLLFISTINRTTSSLFKAIFVAEYIMKIIPKGTHTWNKFFKPSEIVNMTENMSLINVSGINYNILKREWYLGEKIDTNYIMCLQKSLS